MKILMSTMPIYLFWLLKMLLLKWLVIEYKIESIILCFIVQYLLIFHRGMHVIVKAVLVITFLLSKLYRVCYTSSFLMCLTILFNVAELVWAKKSFRLIVIIATNNSLLNWIKSFSYETVIHI